MTGNGIVQIIIYIVVLIAGAIPLGIYMAKVFNGEKTIPDKVLKPLERGIYRITRVKAECEMNWKQYAVALLLFNLVGLVFLYLLLRLQGHLPGNPMAFKGLPRPLAFNTAASFVTNTNWQAYAGETTMSYLSQMLGMTVQNFLSAATGLTVVIALIRGFSRKRTNKVGNFWVDLTRAMLWILIPLSIVLSIIFMWQGTAQNLSPYKTVKTVQGSEQTIPMGPVASQEAIKELGTNGGGFFNANSAHPFENPTPLSNGIQIFSLLLIGAALCITFGRMVGNWKQGAAILVAMLILFTLSLGVCLAAESAGNPRIAKLGVTSPNTMEGKEVRFGVPPTMMYLNSTTSTSSGTVDGSLDSLTPLAGMLPMVNIMLGEVVFGGVGVGLAGMLIFAIFTVFIIGLMVGRTPEYLGKKIESWEMKMAVIVILIPSACILIGAGVAVVTHAGVSSTLNHGPHGLSEILYSFTSAAGNNGSAFAGLNANTAFYNITLGVIMLLARLGILVPVLAIAGSLAAKQPAPVTAGTFRTDKPLFPVLLAAIVLIVGALTFFAALALGPIVEQLMM
ncbi:MAG TPA: potassium-transporting ATPase subunit KdpA [Candidatus Anoxymicrobiaceae bacterium]|jgi:K+-transporting ATPase ATPase A chain